MRQSPNSSIMLPHIPTTVPSTVPATWSSQLTPMMDSTMNLKAAAEPEPTSSCQKTTPNRSGTVPSSPSPKSSNLLHMSSAAEAEMGTLYVTAKELVPICLTLEEMRWKQPMTPIQTDNTTAAGVVNNTIIPKKSKSMDLRFWWMKCRESQQQFRYYWAPGRYNWGDCSTKHQPPIYHEENRARCAGISKGTNNADRFPLPVPFEDKRVRCAGAA
jgi:hypothetical protein